MRVCGTVITALLSAAVGFPNLYGPAAAATVAKQDPAERRGEEIAQSFLDSHGDNVSVVTTRYGISCIASRTLEISDSSYVAPVGADVSFADVTRSPATSIQAIARPGAPVAFRIQLKYSPNPSRPIEMDIGGRTFAIAGALEASGDSVLVEGEVARLLAGALRREAVPMLRATSDDTGRLVADRISAPDMTGLDACVDTLKTRQEQNRTDTFAASNDAPGVDEPDVKPTANVMLINDTVREPGSAVAASSEIENRHETGARLSPPAMPEPVMRLRVDFVARPDPDARISPSVLQNCRMRDIPEAVYLGRLTGVTGFFSQTRDVYVAFDDDGDVQRAYIPGIFDSDFTTGRGNAHASLAADSNLPDRPNTVKGCLGDAPIEAPVCVISGEADDHYSVVECGVPDQYGTLEEFVPPILLASLAGDIDVFGMPVPDLTVPQDGDGTGAFYPVEDQTVVTRTSSQSGATPVSGGSVNRPVFPGINAQPLFPSLSGTGDDPPLVLVLGEGGLVSTPGQASDPVSSVPLPAALWLLMGSLAGFFVIGARGRKGRASTTL